MYKKFLVVLGLMVSGSVSAIDKNVIEEALQASVQYDSLANNPFVDVYDCMFVANDAIARMVRNPLKPQQMRMLLALSQAQSVKKRGRAGAVEAAGKMLHFALELKKAR